MFTVPQNMKTSSKVVLIPFVQCSAGGHEACPVLYLHKQPADPRAEQSRPPNQLHPQAAGPVNPNPTQLRWFTHIFLSLISRFCHFLFFNDAPPPPPRRKTKLWMRKLGQRPRNFFSGNTVHKWDFSCSVCHSGLNPLVREDEICYWSGICKNRETCYIKI